MVFVHRDIFTDRLCSIPNRTPHRLLWGTGKGRPEVTLFKGNLDERHPLLGVFLIPDAVDIREAWLSRHLKAVFLHVSDGLGERFIEAFVRSDMLHAKSLGYCLKSLEFDDVSVWKLFQDLLAILNVDISRTILIMIDSEAITWLGTLAPQHD